MNSQIFPLPNNNRLDLDIAPPVGDNGKPIGAMLVDWGRLEQDDVNRILDFQKKAGLPFGEAGIAMGILDRDELVTERGVWGLPRALHRSWAR